MASPGLLENIKFLLENVFKRHRCRWHGSHPACHALNLILFLMSLSRAPSELGRLYS